MLKMLKSSDIHVDMRVITEQLDNITDKYIYLKDTEMVPDENGIPVYIEGGRHNEQKLIGIDTEF